MTDRGQDSATSQAYDHQLMRRLWQFIRPHRKMLYGSLILLPLSSALELAPPYLIKIAIDSAIIPRQPARIIPIAIALVIALIAQQSTAFIQTWLLELCGQRSMHDLRVAVHTHVLSLRLPFFDRTPIGRVMTRVTNDVESIAEAFSSGLVTVVGDVIKLSGIIVVMLWLNWKLALLTFSILPPLLVVVGILQRLLRSTYRLIRSRLATINATLQEQLNGMRVIQIFGKEARAEEEFGQANESYRNANKASILYDSMLFALVELLGSITVALLLWYGGLKLLAGSISFGLLVAFIEYVQRFFEPIRDISTKYATMQQAMAASERVVSLLDNDELDAVGPDAVGPDAVGPPPPHPLVEAPRENNPAANPPAIVFRNVSFGYTADTTLFEQLSLTLQQGESVAIVGPTGAGKSTIARLLNRLYEPQSGAIELAGVDTRDLPIAELRRRIVVLNQDVFLFAGTVRDNISLHEVTIDHESISRTADRLGISEIVDLDKPVQERGTNLSAGERQLIVFARALVRDPEILVLDEATASVDPESERIIQEGISELMRDRTAIVIAHRLTTIERVDRVLVLNRGSIVEEGSHSELINAGGVYHRLYQLQYV